MDYEYEYEVEVATLAAKCRELFGDETLWFEVAGYRSVALCIIDSIYSTGSHYNSVINVVARYVAYRAEQGANAYDDGVEELLGSFQELGGSDAWADMVYNRKPAHTKVAALLKSEVIYRAAVDLKDQGIQSAKELKKQISTPQGLSELEKIWLRLPSQSSGISFNYFLILAGYQSVKPDRMVLKFIEEHTSLIGRNLGAKKATELISRVAALYPTEARKLDHVVWRYSSGRPIAARTDVHKLPAR